MALLALLAFGSSPDSDENPLFARWWLAWPEQYRNAKGAARRQWYKLRPTKDQAEQMTQAVLSQAHNRKWKEGFAPRPDRWLRDECWDDYVEVPYVAPEKCQHQPTCPSPEWHQVVLARERGDVK